MPKVRKEDGTWEEGKASPKLLREDLRELPGELVVKNDLDIQEEDKIHELDPPHIVEALTYEYQQKIAKDGKEDPKLDTCNLPGGPLAQIGESKKLNQREIDWVRLRLLKVRIDKALQAVENGHEPNMEVFHVWFPQDEVNIYEIRPGNPPSDTDRPPHLKGFHLWIDPKHPSESMRDLTKEVGVDLDWDVRGTWDELYREHEKRRIHEEETGLVITTN